MPISERVYEEGVVPSATQQSLQSHGQLHVRGGWKILPRSYQNHRPYNSSLKQKQGIFAPGLDTIGRNGI